MKNTIESTKNAPSREELMFEYDQLRREILQQDMQSIQVLVGVVLLVSALTTIAFGVAVTSLLVKGILFLLVQVIVSIGLWQTVQRAYTSLTIASYLRTFVEPQIEGLKWESRLKKYRKHAQVIFPHSRFGEFINYLLIYLLLIIVNFFFSAGYIIYEMRLSPFLNLAILLIICVGVLTIWFIRTSLRILRRYSADSGEVFDMLWKEVKDEEKGPQSRHR
jgi:hypothetical protein